MDAHMHKRFSLFLAAALCLGATLGASAALAAREPNMKMGLSRATLTGATYTYKNTATNTEYSNSDQLVGTELFFEYLLSDNFSIEADTTVSPLERSFELGTQGSVAQNVKESGTYTLLGANLYFTKATSKGFQLLMGVATGAMAVGYTFSGGTIGTKSTASAAKVNTVRLALDWLTELAGLRVQYQLVTGSDTDAAVFTGAKQIVTYSGGTASVGVYAFF
jgi:hypothetical protein